MDILKEFSRQALGRFYENHYFSFLEAKTLLFTLRIANSQKDINTLEAKTDDSYNYPRLLREGRLEGSKVYMNLPFQSEKTGEDNQSKSKKGEKELYDSLVETEMFENFLNPKDEVDGVRTWDVVIDVKETIPFSKHVKIVSGREGWILFKPSDTSYPAIDAVLHGTIGGKQVLIYDQVTLMKPRLHGNSSDEDPCRILLTQEGKNDSPRAMATRKKQKLFFGEINLNREEFFKWTLEYEDIPPQFVNPRRKLNPLGLRQSQGGPGKEMSTQYLTQKD